ncbi:MAG: DEAD/DEAH box helicase [Deferribacteres bacterium]|nr:DEAD/DEAH box helicase [Deferribacteres bacterium]
MPSMPDFHPAVATWFQQQFSAPSPPQVQGWPSIAKSEHTLILAPTGSGKTLAAFLWCIDALFRKGMDTPPKTFARNREGVHTLYISPLKALNNDIYLNLQQPLAGIAETAKSLGWHPPEIRTQVRTGDTPSHVRQSIVRRPPHILITTPESLYLLLTSAQGREIFRQLKYIIVDEIHAMCNSKRGVHLSLSLERLMPLCDFEPVRIGLSATQRPLERIAAFLGGQNIDPKTNFIQQRAVNIIDCGGPRQLDLKIECPVDNFNNLPDSTVWPAVISQVYQYICQHRTTLIFVNMRAQAERIARQINELHQRTSGNENAVIAQAHHGSISREVRYQIEARLKNGDIPAVVATGSLELGIDIGSIDLVVHLQAPTSISSGLQRVGRSGHTLAATSKGRIVPLFRADLDDAIAVAASMKQNEIEETTIPENCLDVLAQQILAEAALQEWPRVDLFHLFRQSYCYRNLSQVLFDNVLNMLSGRYQDSQIRALKPRLSWDRVNDRLIAQRGSRLLATMSGGTIPDSGNYTVYLSESNTRLGDLNEEFAFENQVGDTFYLGNNEWRIDQITHDRILVSPVAAIQPKPPFWKGGLLHRDYATSLKIAAFRREFLQHALDGTAQNWLRERIDADGRTSRLLIDYFQDQLDHTGAVATDHELICELYRDTSNEPHVALHSPFGGRVNGAWAIALAAALEKRYGSEVQYMYDDDGILLRLLDTAEPPPFEDLLKMTGDDLEKLLVGALANTPTFAIFFRHNAGRAMLLPRARQGKRIPLWLQRLRSADLLQVVQKYPDFPIVIETYRECLQDIFDLPGLRDVSEKIIAGKIKIHFVQTSYPSPMISGLTFNFLANNLYENDRTRLPGQAAFISSELLADILNKENIPAIVTNDVVEDAERRWQFLASGTRACDAEQLFGIIERLGPISEPDLQQRSAEAVSAWMQTLREAGRITETAAGWIAQTDAAFYSHDPDLSIAQKLIRRYLANHGPKSGTEIEIRTGMSGDLLEQALGKLLEQKLIVNGKLLAENDEIVYCDRDNFAELYRRAISKRRQFDMPARWSDFLQFQLCWHGIGEPNQTLSAVLSKYTGYHMPLHFLEREIFATRLATMKTGELHKIREHFTQLVKNGEFVLYGSQPAEESRRSVFVLARQQGNLRTTHEQLDALADGLAETERTIISFLQSNGASYGKDIIDGTGFSLVQIQRGLAVLANSGLASCDNDTIFLQTILHQPVTEQSEQSQPWQQSLPGWRQRSRLRRPARSQIEYDIRKSMPLRETRWFLTSNFAAFGREVTEEQRAMAQARLLLQRYGILVKEWYRHENGLMPWPKLFYQLKRLEWQGEIYHGYFVAGLSGVQFALPEAVELLKRVQRSEVAETEEYTLLSTIDPALPFGRHIQWNLLNGAGEKIRVTRASSNHILFAGRLPVVYSENFGTRLFALADFAEAHLDELVERCKNWLHLHTDLRPRRRIEIQQIDGKSAAKHAEAAKFLQAGFERERDKLVLWPSRATS